MKWLSKVRWVIQRGAGWHLAFFYIRGWRRRSAAEPGVAIMIMICRGKCQRMSAATITEMTSVDGGVVGAEVPVVDLSMRSALQIGEVGRNISAGDGWSPGRTGTIL
jgi:hypothetical protein